MASAWYYTRDGKSKTGPVSARQLRERALAGALLPTDMIWKEGMPKWKPARVFPKLFEAPAPPKSKPPKITHQPDEARSIGEVFTRFRVERLACIATLTLIATIGATALTIVDNADDAEVHVMGAIVALGALVGTPLWFMLVYSMGRSLGICGGYREEFIDDLAPAYAYRKFSLTQYLLEFGILFAILVTVTIIYGIITAIRRAGP